MAGGPAVNRQGNGRGCVCYGACSVNGRGTAGERQGNGRGTAGAALTIPTDGVMVKTSGAPRKDAMTLDLPDEDVDFLMQVLQNQPLPFVRTAPIINRIGQQIVAHQNPPSTGPHPE